MQILYLQNPSLAGIRLHRQTGELVFTVVKILNFVTFQRLFGKITQIVHSIDINDILYLRAHSGQVLVVIPLYSKGCRSAGGRRLYVYSFNICAAIGIAAVTELECQQRTAVGRS